MTPSIQMVPVDLIDPHPHNPRRDLGNLTELAASIREQGIQQNLLLVPSVAGRFLTAEEEERYGLTKAGGLSKAYTAVIGHRRLAAAKRAGLTEVPAIVNPRLSEAEQVYLMLLENVQRMDLSPVEEAEGYQELLDLGVKVRAIAKATGRAEKTVTARLRLMSLPDDARQKVHLHEATLEDAGKLQALEDRPDLYAKVAARLGTENFTWSLRQALDARKRDMERAPLLARLAELGVRPITEDERKRPYDALFGVQTVAELDAAVLPDDLTEVRYTTPEYDERVFLRRLTVRDETAEAAARAQRESVNAEHERIQAEAAALFALRDEWVRAYCARKRIAAKDQLAIVAAVAPVVLAGGIKPSSFEADEWLRPGTKTDYPDLRVRVARVAEVLPGAEPAALLLAALHIAAGEPWTNAWDRVEPTTLYRLLEQLGYPVSDAERARVTPPVGEDGDDGE